MRIHVWLFFLILSIGALSHSDTLDFEAQNFQLQQQEENLKKLLDSLSELQHEALKDHAANLAFAYLKSGAAQEAIWALDRGGVRLESESMSRQLEDYLKTSKIRAIKYIGRGVSGASIVILENGMKAVLKPKDLPDSISAEVWAYEFDRKSGFNMIPTTVQRRIGGVDYSLQVFIESATDSELNLLGQEYLDHADLYVLDYILGTLDRHGGNSMISRAGRLFAIDHGRIGHSVLSEEFDLRYAKNLKVILKLIELESDPKFIEFAQKYAPTLDMSFALSRIRSMKNALGEDFIFQKSSQRADAAGALSASAMGQQLKSKFDALFSPVKGPTPRLDGFLSVNKSNFSALANTKDEIWNALQNRNYKKFEKVFSATNSHDSFKWKFALSLAEVTKSDALMDEETVRYLKTFLGKNLNTFELMAQQSDSAFLYKLASQDRYFRNALRRGIQSFQDPNMTRRLFAKYLTDSINLSLPNQIATTEWVEVIDMLRQEDIMDLLRLVDPRIVQRASTFHLLEQVYLEDPARYKELNQQVLMKSPYVQRTHPVPKRTPMNPQLREGSKSRLSVQCNSLFSL